ncbi:alpha-(1,3)-fucosyltransferase B [Drosophila innubila]|uniref:alpha-(1,3)-fucosyltransferase B n=1 Tax=Drosophila innubila TaxID=198719 RepID=UPI00148D7EEF|nr:alpha-(1,3)-fucosyltransferase B [Drosophila innubila]
MRPWRNRRLQLVLLSLIWLCFIFVIYWYISHIESDSIKDFTPELLWWTDDMHWKYDETRQCGFSKCRVTNNRQRLSESLVILFYASNMKPHDFPMPRSSRHLWAMLHEESPRNVPYVPHDEFLQHFNYTSTFSRYSDMPLTTQYLPQVSDLTQLDYHTGHLSKQAFQFNGGLASVVFLQTDCNTMSGREDYVRELMKHMKVDSYGGCLHNRDLPDSLQKDYLNNLYSPELLRFLAHYKFMIAIENGVCEDYITEKFWRPLMIGVIPIYFGSPSIRDWQPKNKSAIYIDDFPNAGALAAFLNQLADNDTEYMSYLAHKVKRRQGIDNQKLLNHLITRTYSIKSDQQSDEHSLFHRFECFMCRQIHLTSPPRHADKRHYNCPLPPIHVPLEHQKEPKYGEDWRSMMNMGRCQAQLLNEFWRANQPYTEKQFTERLSKMVKNNKCD